MSSSDSFNKEYHEPERVLDLYKEQSDTKNNRKSAVFKKKNQKPKIPTPPITNHDINDSNILNECIFEQIPSTPIFHTSKLLKIFVSTKSNEVDSLNLPSKKQKTVFYKSSKLIGTTTKSPEELAIEEEFRKALGMKEQLINKNHKTNTQSSLSNNKQTNTFVSVGKTVIENKVFKNEKLVSMDKYLEKKDEINKKEE